MRLPPAVAVAVYAARDVTFRLRGQHADIATDYDEVSADYESQYSRNLSRATAQFVAQLPEERMRPRMRVLELAAGTGALTRALVTGLHTTSELDAVDISGGMLEQNALGLADSTADVRLHRQDAVTYLSARPRDTADLIACAWGVCYMDPRRLRREITRVLAPGGWLCLVENRHDSLREVERLFRDAVLNDPTALASAVPIRLPRDSRALKRRFMPRSVVPVLTMDAESATVFPDAASLMDYISKSGISAGYLNALKPTRRAPFMEQVRRTVERRGAASVPVVHRYSVAIGRRPDDALP
ncbi:class I SAM-dependent methyltransferase [Cellulomonas hominis]|uniref:class I SAM-dependent methyltransferase n=1 Tax=Cellulomonas hominis TaxID=156981 RepID=UPI001BA25A98|nr:class I SAM-dependent methyltransferase [Cellulomonas hominis]VTR75991.1 hypothetical protein CHMI_00747 [Cellulomonas hominis]